MQAVEHDALCWRLPQLSENYGDPVPDLNWPRCVPNRELAFEYLSGQKSIAPMYLPTSSKFFRSMSEACCGELARIPGAQHPHWQAFTVAWRLRVAIDLMPAARADAGEESELIAEARRVEALVGDSLSPAESGEEFLSTLVSARCELEIRVAQAIERGKEARRAHRQAAASQRTEKSVPKAAPRKVQSRWPAIALTATVLLCAAYHTLRTPASLEPTISDEGIMLAGDLEIDGFVHVEIGPDEVFDEVVIYELLGTEEIELLELDAGEWLAVPLEDEFGGAE